MLNLIFTKVLQWIGGKLDGYNMIIGGVVLVIGGILGLLQQMFPGLEVVIPKDLDGALMAIGSGWAVIGGARKGNKIINAVKK